jgi:tRNA(fMet)-specific endonuclease VapC
MIRFLLDANIAIYAMIDAGSSVNRRIQQSEPGAVAMSAISFAEVVLGVRAQKPPPPEVLEAFVEAVPIVPFDEAAARVYAKLPFRRGGFDRLLAAHALSIGATVVTNNEGDFAPISGLELENWTL